MEGQEVAFISLVGGAVIAVLSGIIYLVKAHIRLDATLNAEQVRLLVQEELDAEVKDKKEMEKDIKEISRDFLNLTQEVYKHLNAVSSNNNKG